MCTVLFSFWEIGSGPQVFVPNWLVFASGLSQLGYLQTLESHPNTSQLADLGSVVYPSTCYTRTATWLCVMVRLENFSIQLLKQTGYEALTSFKPLHKQVDNVCVHVGAPGAMQAHAVVYSRHHQLPLLYSGFKTSYKMQPRLWRMKVYSYIS